MTEDQYLALTALGAVRAASAALSSAMPPEGASEDYEAAQRHSMRAVIILEGRVGEVET